MIRLRTAAEIADDAVALARCLLPDSEHRTELTTEIRRLQLLARPDGKLEERS